MVNVMQHKCFPTIINEFQFSMDKQEHDLVIDELNDMEKYKENNLITQTTDDLSKHIPKFTKKIFTAITILLICFLFARCLAFGVKDCHMILFANQ